jgi:hypothetical protein
MHNNTTITHSSLHDSDDTHHAARRTGEVGRLFCGTQLAARARDVGKREELARHRDESPARETSFQRRWVDGYWCYFGGRRVIYVIYYTVNLLVGLFASHKRVACEPVRPPSPLRVCLMIMCQ